MKRILKKNENLVDFVFLNKFILSEMRIAISPELFQKLWDMCQDKKGTIRIEQAKTPAERQHNPFGIYYFSYTTPDQNGKPELVHIGIRNAGLKCPNHKRFFVHMISKKNFQYYEPKSIFAPKIFVGAEKVKPSEKEISR